MEESLSSALMRDSAKEVFAAAAVSRSCSVAACLLLKDQQRSAHPLALKVDSHLDTVGDLDEGNAFIHPVILTIESHCPFNFTGTCALAS